MLFVCAIIGLLSSIAVPRLLKARSAANAASAISSLRAISSGQFTFALTCGGGFYAPTLTQLAKAPPGAPEGFIRGDLSLSDTVDKGGYTIQMSATAFPSAPDTCNFLGPGVTGAGFKAGADSIDPANLNFYAVNGSHAIWVDTASLYAGMPEVGDPPSATAHPIR